MALFASNNGGTALRYIYCDIVGSGVDNALVDDTMVKNASIVIVMG